MKFLQVLIAIGICQVILTAISFPLYELWTPTPLFRIDGAFHWYQIKTAVNLSKTLHTVGYDPYFNAGYPAGIIYNRSAKFAALTAIVLPWLDEVITYKIYVFASAAIAPMCVALALYWLEFNEKVCLIGGILGLFLWWASLFQWFYAAGMVSFVTGSYLALPFTAKFIQILNKSAGWLNVIALGLVGALGIFYHPLFPVPIVFMVAVFLATSWDKVKWRRTVKVAFVVTILAVIPNVWWVYSTHYYGQIFNAGNGDDPYQKLVDINVVWRELLGLWRGNSHGSKAYALLTISSLWAVAGAQGSRDRTIAVSFFFAGSSLILFAAVGAYFEPVAAIQPNRFGPVGYLVMCIPAATGILTIFSRLGDDGNWRWFARVTLGIVAAIVVYLTNEVRREVSFENIGHFGTRPPLVRELGEKSEWLLAWLDSATTTRARVLFEESRGRVYDDSNISGYLAYASDREFIGGPYPCYPFMQFTGFWDGRVFERPIAGMDPVEFSRYLDVYNIGWIVAHSDATKHYLQRMTNISLLATFKGLNAYRVVRRDSFFMRGSGKVQARKHNSLVLSDLAGDEVILKYHYVPGLASDPKASILPVKLLDDPNPFIKILNPPRQLRLYLP